MEIKNQHTLYKDVYRDPSETRERAAERFRREMAVIQSEGESEEKRQLRLAIGKRLRTHLDLVRDLEEILGEEGFHLEKHSSDFEPYVEPSHYNDDLIGFVWGVSHRYKNIAGLEIYLVVGGIGNPLYEQLGSSVIQRAGFVYPDSVTLPDRLGELLRERGFLEYGKRRPLKDHAAPNNFTAFSPSVSTKFASKGPRS